MNTLFRNFAIWMVAAMLSAASAMAGPLKVGDSLPDMAALKFEGALPEMAGHVVLIDFWASWCGPCKKSFPVLKELQEKFAARGLVTVGISLDEDKAAMDQFLKKNTVPFAIIRDAQGKSAEIFGVEKMPTSFIVGADGKIRSIHGGFENKTRQEYFNEIEEALKAAGK
jgi:thiol-disulfide isomerase/thioredoxin